MSRAWLLLRDSENQEELLCRYINFINTYYCGSTVKTLLHENL